MSYGDSVERKSVMRKFIALIILAGCGGNVPSYIGHSYLGAEYMNSPLGECALPDDDPLIRFDAFDCTTFVETVLADGDETELNQIRYADGCVGFLTRNHFVESDWLVNNAKLVENVSSEYAATKIRSVVIDKQSWFRVVHGIDVDVPSVHVQLEYIPYENLGNLTVSQPMIVLFVTDNPKIRDKIGTDLAVVHMGFVLPNGMLRHASSQYGRVLDVDFNKYVAQRMRDKTHIGVTLVKIK